MVFYRFHYFISGSIGIGKTSTINHFMIKYGLTKIKTYYIKEYIDFDCLGAQKLDDWINNKMSLLDFQLYIIEQFRKQLQSEDYIKSKFVIWERHPEEALRIFSDGLSINDKEILTTKIRELEEEFDIPQLSPYTNEHAIKISTYGLSDESIADIIYDEMKNNLLHNSWECTFVFLYIPKQFIEEQQSRIFKRGRPMEIKTYKNIEKLEEINQKYFNFAHDFLTGPFINGSEI